MTSGSDGIAVGRLDHRLGEGPGAVDGEAVEAHEGLVVEPVDGGLVGVVGQQHVVDERDPLAEVVEGGQLADDRQRGVGVARGVVGDVGEVLDLAHDVVAEVADEAAVQRGQVVEHRRAVALEHPLDGGEDALVGGHALGQVTGDLEDAVAQHQRGERVAAHERPPAPALAVLDGLEQEAGLVVTAQPGEGGDGRDQVGEQLPPHGHDGVVGGEAGGTPRGWGAARGPQASRTSELVDSSGPNARKKQE